MKIFMNTFGSQGDVQPFVALGQRLQANGHEVTICTASRFESFITEHGLNYGYMTDEGFQLIDTDSGILEDSAGFFGMMKTNMKLIKLAKPLNRKMMQNSWDAGKDVEPDLVIYHPKALGAVSIAERFNAPAICVNLQPMMAPTAAFPPIGIPALNMGWYNKFAYKLIGMGFSQYAGELNEIRQNQMGLDKLPKGGGVWEMSDGSPIPIIHAFSPHVIAPPKDWPDYYTADGYWFLDEQDDWQPSAELQAFLDAGDPPVYVGFGSMSGRDPKRITHIVIEALQRANVRGVIATGWGGMDATNLPDSIFKIDKAPHAWLFPKMSAVVHHGGAGTTAASLRAGRPTVICSFFGDQPFWGKRVAELGVGPKSIPQKKLTVEKLTAALQVATGDTVMRQNAARLGQQLSAEDGIGTSIQHIEQWVAQFHSQKTAVS